MTTLIIDNYDSFTYNLYQQIGRLSGAAPRVVRNDQLSLQQLVDLRPARIVLSPGPGRPSRQADFGICAAVIDELEVPILGVCLGCQGLAESLGGQVGVAEQPMHGRLSALSHDGKGLFAGLPQGLQVVRYHSLAVLGELPAELQRSAWTEDGVLMGLRHRRRPLWGVQFHPESIATEHGDQILSNFLELSGASRGRRSRTAVAAGLARGADHSPGQGRKSRLRWRRLDHFVEPEAVFCQFYAQSPNAFWLDSSLASSYRSRFSFMGDASGPRAEILRYRVGGSLEIERQGRLECRSESIFDYLERRLEDRLMTSPELPFDFNGGFVGYLGYELREECGTSLHQRSALPDGWLIFADRLLAFDHQEQCVYMLALGEDGSEDCDRAWLRQVESELEKVPPAPRLPARRVLSFKLARAAERYLADIESCLEEIRQGESYELCLTNQLLGEPLERPLDSYRWLRRINPAPYSSFLRCGDFSLLCSSPEQFLQIDRRGQVTSKPIKGTRARHTDPLADRRRRLQLQTDIKDRAENLMIVDLLRNDLGQVCELGSVRVPELMRVETYATVHQLVSTVRGQLRSGVGAVACVRAAFPGGSMTGAPKRRSMEILERLEGRARGPYAGALGFFGLGGTADLAIVIRTAVASSSATEIGTGGAIVALSEPQAELAEMLIKAEPLLEALGGSIDLPAKIEK